MKLLLGGESSFQRTNNFQPKNFVMYLATERKKSCSISSQISAEKYVAHYVLEEHILHEGEAT